MIQQIQNLCSSLYTSSKQSRNFIHQHVAYAFAAFLLLLPFNILDAQRCTHNFQHHWSSNEQTKQKREKMAQAKTYFTLRCRPREGTKNTHDANKTDKNAFNVNDRNIKWFTNVTEMTTHIKRNNYAQFCEFYWLYGLLDLYYRNRYLFVEYSVSNVNNRKMYVSRTFLLLNGSSVIRIGASWSYSLTTAARWTDSSDSRERIIFWRIFRFYFSAL